jgi:hypothetical protein
MRWVTRKNAAVDRIACPWLIRRFVDPDAEFVYVEAADVDRVARDEGATPFDVGGARLGHVDGRCSFESILVEFGLTDPALKRLGDIVHGADIESDSDRPSEAPGLKAIALGFRKLYGEQDHEKLRAQTPMYDALYAWCQDETAQRAKPR